MEQTDGRSESDPRPTGQADQDERNRSGRVMDDPAPGTREDDVMGGRDVPPDDVLEPGEP